jgi:outer membrane cobalamin receptor
LTGFDYEKWCSLPHVDEVRTGDIGVPEGEKRRAIKKSGENQGAQIKSERWSARAAAQRHKRDASAAGQNEREREEKRADEMRRRRVQGAVRASLTQRMSNNIKS